MTLWEHLQKLAETTQEIEENKKQGDNLKTKRNTEIKAAYDDGARISEICRATGLTRTSIYRIVGSQ